MQKTKEDEYLDKWIKDIAPKLKSKLEEIVDKQLEDWDGYYPKGEK